jgi:cobalamin synthase
MDFDVWIGDDLLLLEYLENPSLGYSKNISNIVTWAQGGIWRPFWQFVSYILFKIFDDNRNEWLGFSIFLIILSLFAVIFGDTLARLLVGLKTDALGFEGEVGNTIALFKDKLEVNIIIYAYLYIFI